MKFNLVILLVVFGNIINSQKEITWKDLECDFDEIWNEEYQSIILKPKFLEKQLNLDLQEVEIEGIIVEIDLIDSISYVLCAESYTLKVCSFGAGGPDKVIELQFKELPKNFKFDDKCKVKGTLHLNSDNILKLTYTLENVEIRQ